MRLSILVFFLCLSARGYTQGVVLRDSLVRQSDILISNHQYESALKTLKYIEDSTDLEVIQKRGLCLSRLGNYPEAIHQFEELLLSDSTNRNTLVQLGQLYSKNGQLGKSKACYYRLIGIDSTNSYYHKQFAATALQQNDIVNAATYFYKTIELNPKDIEAYAALGNILIETEQYDLADSVLGSAVGLTGHPQLKVLQARALLAREQFELVIEIIEPMITGGDTTITTAKLLGVSYFQTGKFEGVIPLMNYLLVNGAEADWIWYYIGASHQQLGRPAEAIPFIAQAIETGISENISNYYSQLAVAYEEVKEFKQAIKYYKAAYESSRSDIYLYHLARNYDVFYKDKSQAVAYYKRYLSSGDTIKMAKDFTRFRLEQLRSLR